jgi:hypothetical protein
MIPLATAIGVAIPELLRTMAEPDESAYPQ